MEKEALTLEALAIAMAVRNSDGLVIAQVERIAERGSLNPRQVKIPGIFVDCVVLAKPENHWQTFSVQYDPAFSGEIRAPTGSVTSMEMSDERSSHGVRRSNLMQIALSISALACRRVSQASPTRKNC
jgi:Acyl CoA:acetate/3-ketoacid CoA transferase